MYPILQAARACHQGFDDALPRPEESQLRQHILTATVGERLCGVQINIQFI